MLDLLPTHECDCDRRWTTRNAGVPHKAECDRLKACTCHQQWAGPALYEADHSPDCGVRQWSMARPAMPDNYDDEEVIVP